MLSNSQVIELPIKHPELFESLGIAQPKVIFPLIYGGILHPPSAYTAVNVFVDFLSFTYHRVSCSMGHLVQEKLCWRGQWHIIPIAHSSGCLVLN
jgi:hypothetical protein